MTQAAQRALELWIDARLEGRDVDPEELLHDAGSARSSDLEQLRRWISSYGDLDAELSGPTTSPEVGRADGAAVELPQFEGFRTLERLGSGGSGDVYKLEDLQLQRVVAGKLLRPDSPLNRDPDAALAEARAQASSADAGLVPVLEVRATDQGDLLLTEFVAGFSLGELGPSLDATQLAGVLARVARAVGALHARGLQHRDLKPSNVVVGADMRPRVLDFGLSTSSSEAGHFRGTPAYMAPELLDPDRPVDSRCDVYALGVSLYELLTGSLPYRAGQEHQGEPPLPLELDGAVPEPLQAIALRAMELEPDDRYSSLDEMADDFDRFVRGEPVRARPRRYRARLESQIAGHLGELENWRRSKLIYPHEAARLERSYRQLLDRGEDWIVDSRRLTWARIVLYLGVLAVGAGALFAFVSAVRDATDGVLGPLLSLGLPTVALAGCGLFLDRRGSRGIGTAFLMASVLVLPVFVALVLRELGWPGLGSRHPPLFAEAGFENLHLQLGAVAALLWSVALAVRTRTAALASMAVGAFVLLCLFVLGDLGLQTWLEEANWDRVGWSLAPSLLVVLGAALVLERRGASWAARPIYVAGAVLALGLGFLVCLDGELLRHLGISLAPLEPEEVSNETLLETCLPLALLGALAGLIGHGVERSARPDPQLAATLLLVVSPFATLGPVFVLVAMEEYSLRLDWLYLVLAVGVALASRIRERRSFYIAGFLHAALALVLLTGHRDWWDRAGWPALVLLVGVGLLGLGSWIKLQERPDRVED